jgi:hypothetical protein
MCEMNMPIPVLRNFQPEITALWDHTEFMILALQLNDVYRESILGFASKKALPGEHIALV